MVVFTHWKVNQLFVIKLGNSYKVIKRRKRRKKNLVDHQNTVDVISIYGHAAHLLQGQTDTCARLHKLNRQPERCEEN